MGEVVGKILDGLVEVFKKHNKNPKLWIGVGIVLLVFVFLIPYIDSNFFYFSRMEKRINILEQVMSLDRDVIESNPVFLNEYQSILQEIEQQNERSFNSVLNKLVNLLNEVMAKGKGQGNKGIQFITGALLCILLALCIPFMRTFDSLGEKVIAFILVIIIGCILGAAAIWLPVIVSPWVNYVGFPLLQMILLFLWVAKSGSGSKQEGRKGK